MNITTEELQTIALGVVSDNQCEFVIDNDQIETVYRLAYNDGVINFLNAILEKKGETL